VSVFTADYFALKLEVISRYFVLIPELFSLIIAVSIVAQSLVLRQWAQPVRYVWLIVTFVLVCLIGAVAETVSPGPLISGIREYFKFLPLLFLPAVYEFSDKQLKVLLGTFLFMAALQVPLAFYQRFVQFSHMMHTGDPITGTVTTSSSLTIVLCLAIALVMTLYVHRKVTLSVALLLFCYLAAPTAINETKATTLLLPIAVIGPFILTRGIDGKWRKAFPIVAICALGLVAYMLIYNTLVQERWGGNTINDFFSTGHYELYLYRGIEVGENSHVIGRIDSMILPVAALSEEWMQLLFGLGIGNLSPSSLPGVEGAYYEMGARYGFGRTAVGNLIWETGIIGLLLYLLLYVFVWRDSRRYASANDKDKWYGTWWSTCILILFFALAYKSVVRFSELGYMLFFWSGFIASRIWWSQNPSESRVGSRPSAVPQLTLAGRS